MGSLVTGGRTLYGLALGVVTLDTKFPRFVGDVGNAATWNFPVMYRIVRDAIPARLAQPDPDGSLLDPFREAVRELERQGVRAITTTCGFLAAFQSELAAAVSIPVFTSPLLQVPLAARAIRPDRCIAIFTAVDVLTERHFNGAGWSSDEVPVVQVAPPSSSHFVATFVHNAPEADRGLLERDVVELTERALRDHPDLGAVVLECANFTPFSQLVRRIAKVPVFDFHTLAMQAFLATTGVDFPIDKSP